MFHAWERLRKSSTRWDEKCEINVRVISSPRVWVGNETQTNDGNLFSDLTTFSSSTLEDTTQVHSQKRKSFSLVCENIPREREISLHISRKISQVPKTSVTWSICCCFSFVSTWIMFRKYLYLNFKRPKHLRQASLWFFKNIFFFHFSGVGLFSTSSAWNANTSTRSSSAQQREMIDLVRAIKLFLRPFTHSSPLTTPGSSLDRV